MIAIIDYGMGNIHSVRKALEMLGAVTLVTNKPKDLEKAEKLVLPGVGAFGDAMKELKKQKLISPIIANVASGKPFLGICLGMHLLFESSEEAAGIKGLGLLKGKVRKFPKYKGLKVPHMGWNQILIKKKNCVLFKGLKDKSSVYFCHSYYPQVKDKGVSAGMTDYGVVFPSIVWQDNILAAQFHPEKSQGVGLQILKNFVQA